MTAHKKTDEKGETMIPLSPVTIYKEILPKTNCGDCGLPTCFAFSTLVVVEKLPLSRCPHIDAESLERNQKLLDAQYQSGRWVKKDPVHDALLWARERSASMRIQDLPERIGGTLKEEKGEFLLELPYFNDTLVVRKDGIGRGDGTALNRWEQVFIYNHIAQGGAALPTGRWIGFVEIPNTVSKIKSMKEQVENPVGERFRGRIDELLKAAQLTGGIPVESERTESADAAVLFRPLPRIPVMLLFWDEEENEGFEATVRLLFDETITEHLDVESIMFLSERIRQLLTGDEE